MNAQDKNTSIVSGGLDPILQGEIEVGEGWLPIVDQLLADLERLSVESRIPCPVTYVGQALGALVVRAATGSERARNLIRTATVKAKSTCELCGSPGKLYHHVGWTRVTCPPHSSPKKWPKQ